MAKQVVNKKQTKANTKAQTQNKIANMQSVISYVAQKAKSNNKVSLQKVTGYIAVKYANKTICELHDKKRAIAHITISNASKAFAILQKANAVTRIVPDSYGWRLNTECLLKTECLNVIADVIDSLIAETEEAFNAKTQQKQQTKKVA